MYLYVFCFGSLYSYSHCCMEIMFVHCIYWHGFYLRMAIYVYKMLPIIGRTGILQISLCLIEVQKYFYEKYRRAYSLFWFGVCDLLVGSIYVKIFITNRYIRHWKRLMNYTIIENIVCLNTNWVWYIYINLVSTGIVCVVHWIVWMVLVGFSASHNSILCTQNVLITSQINSSMICTWFHQMIWNVAPEKNRRKGIYKLHIIFAIWSLFQVIVCVVGNAGNINMMIVFSYKYICYLSFVDFRSTFI